MPIARPVGFSCRCLHQALGLFSRAVTNPTAPHTQAPGFSSQELPCGFIARPVLAGLFGALWGWVGGHQKLPSPRVGRKSRTKVRGIWLRQPEVNSQTARSQMAVSTSTVSTAMVALTFATPGHVSVHVDVHPPFPVLPCHLPSYCMGIHVSGCLSQIPHTHVLAG